jgi:GTP-binding protein EngB required for normal cell division
MALEENYLVFTGRPNAGKSSIISYLTGLKIPIGKHPGTTKKLVKYPISKGLTIIDMPGYGIRKGASKSWSDQIKNLILEFLQEETHRIILATHVLNITTFLEVEERLARKGYINLDVEMVGFLYDTLGHYPLVAANKIDKKDHAFLHVNLEAFIDRISGGTPKIVRDYVFPLSAKTGQGMGEFKSAIYQRLREKGFSHPFKYFNV